jgi:hypothetical protein
MSPTAPDDYDRLIEAVRAFTRRRAGQEPLSITITVPVGHGFSLPVPPAHLPPVAPTLPSPPISPAPDASVPSPPGARREGRPRHAADFRWVSWPGLGEFTFQGDKQARVVETLWRAWEEGEPYVAQAELLRAADAGSERVVELFRGHRAWRTLIVPGPVAGTFTLAPLPAELGGVEGEGP